MSKKAELRKQWMAREAGLAENYIMESNAGIIRNLFSLEEFQDAETMAGYIRISRFRGMSEKGKIGSRRRAENLTPERRSEIARQGALAKHKKYLEKKLAEGK